MEVRKIGYTYQPNGWASKLRQEGSHATAMLAGTVRITVVLGVWLSLCGSLCNRPGEEDWHNGYWQIIFAQMDCT